MIFPVGTSILRRRSCAFSESPHRDNWMAEFYLKRWSRSTTHHQKLKRKPSKRRANFRRERGGRLSKSRALDRQLISTKVTALLFSRNQKRRTNRPKDRHDLCGAHNSFAAAFCPVPVRDERFFLI